MCPSDLKAEAMLLSPGSQQRQQQLLQETVPAQAQEVTNGGSGVRVALTYKRPRVGVEITRL